MRNLQKSENLNFTREDWTSFKNLERLSQRAGVRPGLLRRLVVKELVDNALDASEDNSTKNCELGELGEGGFYAQDGGPGIDPEDLGRMFSINRPMETTKLWRMPTRGALGNGLRLVTGAVLCSRGSIEVWTRNVHARILPQKDTGQSLVELEEADWPVGTRIEVYLGEVIPKDPDFLSWGLLAMSMKGGTQYKGNPSPHWYTVDAFLELFHAAGDASVREVVSRLEGCKGDKAGVVAQNFLNRKASSLNREEAADLLDAACKNSTPVKPQRLGVVGQSDSLPSHYVKTYHVLDIFPVHDSRVTHIPYVFEVWAETSDEDELHVLVNRSPIASPLEISRERDKTSLLIWGCGLGYSFKAGTHPAKFIVNIITPFMPTLSESKAPDLEGLWTPLKEALEKAARKRKKPSGEPNGSRLTEKEIILQSLDEGIDKVSGGGQYRYNLRQLFYVIRPIILDCLGKEPDYLYFGTVIGDYEASIGSDLPGIYRDTRGTLYHPHTQELIPIGTLAVEKYKRPDWTFNKILYVEKEGFFEILIRSGWCERNDCALLTSKGYASRAARDLLDLLGETGEEIQFFCIHDADGPGTVIYQSLVEATRARPGRRVKVINLGLEPEEALEMKLQVENLKKSKTVAVADYVPDKWSNWFQSKRIELNAMTTPQFLEWLEKKFGEHAIGKLIPPLSVMEDQLGENVEELLQNSIREKILKENEFDEQVWRSYFSLRPEIEKAVLSLEDTVTEALDMNPEKRWSEPIYEIASELVDSEAEVS